MQPVRSAPNYRGRAAESRKRPHECGHYELLFASGRSRAPQASVTPVDGKKVAAIIRRIEERLPPWQGAVPQQEGFAVGFRHPRVRPDWGKTSDNMPELGVNIDHVATVRQARRTYEPDPVWAAALAEMGGADGITLHLREDRRHILDRDLRILRETVTVKLNLEMACEQEVVDIACEVKPDQATLVPERREEITTEGGLDVCGQLDRVSEVVRELQQAGISVSLFLDPDQRAIDAAAQLGVDAVELHTGQYALAQPGPDRQKELDTLKTAGAQIRRLGMTLHAGHGLTYRNVGPVAAIEQMHELNIGHSIVARAMMVGMERAVREMKRLVL